MASEVNKLADAIGLPDKEDKERIQRWILKYEKENPGEFKFHRDFAKERLKDPTFGVVDEVTASSGVGGAGANRRYLFELPVPFGNWLSQAYPLMFKDKRHTRWFCKNFPELMIPERY